MLPILVSSYATYPHGMPNSCTEQVTDQKKQVAAFVSTNIRRNENLIVNSIENRIKMEAATAEKSNHLSIKLS